MFIPCQQQTRSPAYARTLLTVPRSLIYEVPVLTTRDLYRPCSWNAKPSTTQKHVPRGRIQPNVSPDKQDNTGSSAGGPFHVSELPFDSVESPPFSSKTSRASAKAAGNCQEGDCDAYQETRESRELRVPSKEARPMHATAACEGNA
ncbi:hypothetical protein V502_08509 [Pseudogymnoascus sp. VKM F-4520 (FW-2644)]|nr:hypothetical protein V502_08509 [Pseudogymnoascus sp. VKM F-4520 (FW-2644)]